MKKIENKENCCNLQHFAQALWMAKAAAFLPTGFSTQSGEWPELRAPADADRELQESELQQRPVFWSLCNNHGARLIVVTQQIFLVN